MSTGTRTVTWRTGIPLVVVLALVGRGLGALHDEATALAEPVRPGVTTHLVTPTWGDRTVGAGARVGSPGHLGP